MLKRILNFIFGKTTDNLDFTGHPNYLDREEIFATYGDGTVHPLDKRELAGSYLECKNIEDRYKLAAKYNFSLPQLYNHASRYSELVNS